MFSHILKLNYSFFSGRLFGDVLSRFESLDEIIKVVTSVFLISYIDGVMALFTMAMMFAYSWKLALLSCVSLIFYALLRTVRVAPLHGATAQQIALKARQETHLMETVRGLRTIKLFQEETLRLREWINIATAQLNASGRLSNASEFYQVLSGSLTGTERIGIVWWGAAMVIHGDFSVGGLVAFLAYREQADKRIVNVIDAVSKTRLLQMHLRRVVEITSEEPEENRLLIQNGSRSGDKEFREIRAENIAFRYSSDDKYILKGVDLRLSRLDSVAIIGPSGSGKTTLAQILAGLLRPSLGQVVLDGRVCVSSALPELRDICGTVMQDDYLFNGTIIENVSFFEDRPDLERVTECLSTACIVDEVNDMPAQGYTRVGDMGSTLSGGQRQRILLARALYRKPAILILDEATSQLDIATERRVVNNIKALGLARICVAHRYETIKSCERFLSLSGGKIIRRGAVEELERPVA
ncbi:hypothetical protein A0U93_00055 [Neoasaia chiangmaiensis]|uniref:Uncharacterized protein n=2 Tax=Neoasaia chiangmaiensis TaxID=320497 RepID=A0A1U9KLK9_9PROT|nr:hypothetical protein A0U93_00055 [Neoasaia chiangmaiensis]